MRTLSREEAKSFYDDFGDKQDRQSFYEDRALQLLVANAAFDGVQHVLEFGCGTGRFALDLLQHHLPGSARYLGMDISSTMVDLAAARLAQFAPRASIVLVEGTPALPAEDASVDRFVSTYVFDLLPASEQLQLLAEAVRVLRPDGLLCLVGITSGITPLSRAVMGAWQWLFARNPSWVGGCRPTRVTEFFPGHSWQVRYRTVVISWGIASEVVVAAPLHRTAHV
jgi:ubiquinone/menaquinone biosynthesis C-methylase UbiE